MLERIKPNRKYEHLYAILRYDQDDDSTPIDQRLTVKKVVNDPSYADAEVKRLNSLNQGKGCHYFYQITRFEDVTVDALDEASASPSEHVRK